MDNELFEKRLQMFRDHCQAIGLMPEVVFARGTTGISSNTLMMVSGPTITAKHIADMREAIDIFERARGL